MVITSVLITRTANFATDHLRLILLAVAFQIGYPSALSLNFVHKSSDVIVHSAINAVCTFMKATHGHIIGNEGLAQNVQL